MTGSRDPHRDLPGPGRTDDRARGIRSSSGEPYPVAEALGVLAGLAGAPVEVGSSADSRVWVMTVTTPGGRVTLAANLDGTAREVRVRTDRIIVPAGGWLLRE
ncbi:hypothetical protein AB0O90_10885 [Microbacterium testaceum]|uniref:hypothetical protein n=1 Tax=Microbacterium testaceum TaxID=2033 RepID=UPI00342FD4FC